MTLLAELISDEYRKQLSKTLTNHIDSSEREYMTSGINELLYTLDNVCILGLNAGKSYLAKTIEI